MSITSASFTPSFGPGAVVPGSSTAGSDPSVDSTNGGSFDRLVQHYSDDGDDNTNGADAPRSSSTPSNNAAPPSTPASNSAVQSADADEHRPGRSRKSRGPHGDGRQPAGDQSQGHVEDNATNAANVAAAVNLNTQNTADDARRIALTGTAAGGTTPGQGDGSPASTVADDQTASAQGRLNGTSFYGAWSALGAGAFAKRRGGSQANSARTSTSSAAANGNAATDAAAAATADTDGSTAALSFGARMRAAFGTGPTDHGAGRTDSDATDVNALDAKDAHTTVGVAGGVQVANASSSATGGGSTADAGGDGRGGSDRAFTPDWTPATRTTGDTTSTAAHIMTALPMAGGASLVGSAGATSSADGAAAAQLTDHDGAGAAMQIVQTMKVLTSEGGGVATVTLEPTYLGAVTVSVKVDTDSVTAAVHADSPAVREWLRSNESTLRESLSDQGLKLDRLEVSEPAQTPRRDADSGSSSSSSDEEPRQQRPRPDSDETGSAFEIVV